MTDRSERPSNPNPYVLPNVWKTGAPTPFISVPSAPGTSPRIQSPDIRPIPRPAPAAKGATAAASAPRPGATNLGAHFDPYVGLAAASAPGGAPRAPAQQSRATPVRPPEPSPWNARALPSADIVEAIFDDEAPAATAAVAMAAAPAPAPTVPSAALAAAPRELVQPAVPLRRAADRAAATRYGTYGALAAAALVIAVGAFVVGRGGHPAASHPVTATAAAKAPAPARPLAIAAAPATVATTAATPSQPPAQLAAVAATSPGRERPAAGSGSAPVHRARPIQLAAAPTPGPGLAVRPPATTTAQPTVLAAAPPPLILPPAIAAHTPPLVVSPAAAAPKAAVDPNAPIVTNSPEKQ